MKNQRGSVLVGVLGLGLAMTIAAAGLITSAASVSAIEIDSGRDLQLHYAAEAGMQMGVRWTRAFDEAIIDNHTWPAGQPVFVITRGDAGYETINGMRVKVELLHGVVGVGVHSIRVTAKDPAKAWGDLRVTWLINSAEPAIPLPIRSTPALTGWTETYRPYIP